MTAPTEWRIIPGVVVVEDNDPSVRYSGRWTHFEGRPEIYTGGTYHVTYVRDASVWFSFEGTHLWVVGDYNDDHGSYAVSIDGGSKEIHSTSWSHHLPFRVMFERVFEENDIGPHTIEIYNIDGGRAVGIDAFAYRPAQPGLKHSRPTPTPPTQMAVPTTFPKPWVAPPSVKLVVDNDPCIEYSTGWSHFTGRPEMYTGGSYHLTYTAGATATFSFEGTYLWIIGDHNDDHGKYTVTINGGKPEGRDTFWTHHRPFCVLFERKFDHTGPHSIVLRNEDEGRAFGLDAFAYLPATPASSSSASTKRDVPEPESHKQDSSPPPYEAQPSGTDFAQVGRARKSIIDRLLCRR
ncbi:hypothetical protein BKA62DRAFT_695748 [Auriculariales sp. MPI-PUGE-AT-0066]|nr:hypothetical protein BKA62DRAFT_695748 [Auriculariales sp. MPI-PUGE-AT-0066]